MSSVTAMMMSRSSQSRNRLPLRLPHGNIRELATEVVGVPDC